MNANFREAIKSGDKDAIEREGAKKLQSVWRIKQAKKLAQAKKEEARTAFLDAAARKVQSCYRIRCIHLNLLTGGPRSAVSPSLPPRTTTSLFAPSNHHPPPPAPTTPMNEDWPKSESIR